MSQTPQTDNTALAVTDSPLAIIEKLGFSSTGITIPADIEQKEWVAVGQAIRYIQGTTSRWLIGDWLAFGESKWGEKYAQGLNLGLDYQYLADCLWVARRFEFSRRHEKLSWSHHREVAALPAEAAESLLVQAEGEGLSTKDMREAAREWVRNQGEQPASAQQIIQTGGAHKPLVKIDTNGADWQKDLRLKMAAISPFQRVRIIVTPLPDDGNGADNHLPPMAELPPGLRGDYRPDWLDAH